MLLCGSCTPELLVSEEEKEEFLVYIQGEHRVYFKHNSVEIEDEGVERVNKLIKELSIVQNVTVVLYGYSDMSEPADKKLSENRIDAVKTALQDSGVIEANQITIKTFAFGKYDPMVSLGTHSNNPISRRVDMFIVANK
jgi:outer membrane protein OmpA-like peptidoglycan-associated protein